MKNIKEVTFLFRCLHKHVTFRQNQDGCVSLEKFEKLAIDRTIYQKCAVPSGEQSAAVSNH